MRKTRLKMMTALLLTFCFILCSVPAMAGGKININAADKETLDTIEHIGPAYAERIIEYREKHPFETIDEIKEIKGIGEKTYQDIKDDITVGEG